MIYLNTPGLNSLGDDTFWTWFIREFKGETTVGWALGNNPDDVVLQYSTMGASKHQNTIGLLWELYPEMEVQLKSTEFKRILDIIYQCAATSKKKGSF